MQATGIFGAAWDQQCCLGVDCDGNMVASVVDDDELVLIMPFVLDDHGKNWLFGWIPYHSWLGPGQGRRLCICILKALLAGVI